MEIEGFPHMGTAYAGETWQTLKLWCASCFCTGHFLLETAGSVSADQTNEAFGRRRVKMANPKNNAELAALKEKFEEASSVVLTEYRGLTVSQLQDLRGQLGFDVELHVAKNTLVKLAANEQGIEGLDDLLVGPTAVAFIKGEAAVDAAKVMKKFAKDNDAFVLKGGFMDGNALSAADVDALAEMDNRETTLAKLAGAFQGSLAKAAGLFQAPASKTARLVAALQDKQEAA